jgi:hypothetical protein
VTVTSSPRRTEKVPATSDPRRPDVERPWIHADISSVTVKMTRMKRRSPSMIQRPAGPSTMLRSFRIDMA